MQAKKEVKEVHKRSLFIAVFIALLFLLSNSAFPFVIFEQNFECNSNCNCTPSDLGWQGATSALSIVSTPDPSAPAYGDCSMKYTDNNSHNGYSPYHTFAPQTGLLKVSMDLRKDWGDNYMIYIVGGDNNPSNYGANIYMGRKFSSESGDPKMLAYFDNTYHNLEAFIYDTWYHVDFIINIPTNTYDIYIDRELKASNAHFRGYGTVTSLRYIKFGYTSWGEVSGYIDNIKISVIPEPASILLLLSGLLGIATIIKKRI